MVDSIADALIRVKNGYLAGSQSVNVRYSKIVLHILKLLEKEGYIDKVSYEKNTIIVLLKYTNRAPAITEVKRVSKPSLRIYKGAKQLPKVLNGLGIAIVSTPKGLMTDKDARKQKVGGEVLALVW